MMVSRQRWLGVSWLGVVLLLVGCATAVSAPTPTPETVAIAPTSTATTWVATVAEGFEMIEVKNPSDFIEEEVINADKTYRAMEVCQTYCDILVEDFVSGKVYKLAAPSLNRNRFFIDLAWSDETILEFTLVT